MEKAQSIDHSEMREGVFIELECFICGESDTMAADDKDSLTTMLDDAGWMTLDSDKRQTIGHWCGCSDH